MSSEVLTRGRKSFAVSEGDVNSIPRGTKEGLHPRVGEQRTGQRCEQRPSCWKTMSGTGEQTGIKEEGKGDGMGTEVVMKKRKENVMLIPLK